MFSRNPQRSKQHLVPKGNYRWWSRQRHSPLPYFSSGGREIAIEDYRGETVLTAAYLAAIVESSDDAIIGKDLSGTIQSWNRGAAEIFGYAPDEVIGQSIHLLIPPSRFGEENQIVQRIRRGEKVVHFETVRRRKDGSDFPVSVTISPIHDAHGAIVGASKVLRDVSERHRAQQELQEANTRLELVVLERTKALAERDLLLREVYHRVKNNLQVVDAMLLMRAVKTSDPEARETLSELRSRVFALGLVHQQLMGSADLKTFDIEPFLKELLANIMGGMAPAGIKLKVEACPLAVDLDYAVPFGLLVTEIVTNSLKHAFSDGEGEIAVALRTMSGDRVNLTVVDNGRALADKAEETPKAGSGTNIIRKLVAQLSGELSVRRDGGTLTDIVMPLPGLR